MFVVANLLTVWDNVIKPDPNYYLSMCCRGFWWPLYVCMYVYVAESPLDLCRLDYKRMPCLFSWADVLWSCTITYQAASIWLIRVDARVFLAQRDWDADQCSGKCRFVRYATPTRHSFVAWPLLVAASRNCSNWLRSLYWKCKVG